MVTVWLMSNRNYEAEIRAIPAEHWVRGESDKIHWAGCTSESRSLVRTDDKKAVTCRACCDAIEYKPL